MSLIADLYWASADNRRFLHARFLSTEVEIARYRKLVEEAVYPDPLNRRPVRMRDPNDDFVLELAVTAACDYIVTHNVADFAGIGRFGVKHVTLGRFLRQLEEAS